MKMATFVPSEVVHLPPPSLRPLEELTSIISRLLESVLEPTDTTGLQLVNPQVLHHVRDEQQKHLKCLQDPSGIQLYTKVGTLQKGGKELPVFRYGRESSFVKVITVRYFHMYSFHIIG